jgi:hypothetical protein
MTTLTELRLSPRWNLKVGDTVKVQRKPGGRIFAAKVRRIFIERDQHYVEVIDARTGGCCAVSVDLIRNTRKGEVRA